MALAVGISDLTRAAGRLAGNAVRTPLLTSPDLDRATGARVFLKPENLQRTGSFKFRGAYVAVSRLAEAGARHVVACSSGNHAQGVAEAARLLGLAATIVMPADAPTTKLDRTRRLGADLVTYDRATVDRDRLTADVAAAIGAPIVHPYENTDVIAGQGTIGLEVADDLDRIGVTPDVALICAGGGGLAAGCAIALTERFPGIAVHTVEPEGFDDQARSFASGRRERNARTSGSICDAILTPTPGEMTFEINRARIASGLAVSDAEALAAVAYAARELKLILEPGGAVSLAALLSAKAAITGKTVVVVLSGGNVDAAVLARALDG